MATKKKTDVANDVNTVQTVAEDQTRPAGGASDSPGTNTRAVSEAEAAAIVQPDTPAALEPSEMPTHIEVSAFVDGFRRCGRAWSAEKTVVSLDNFRPAQIQALLWDANLKTRLITVRRKG